MASSLVLYNKKLTGDYYRIGLKYKLKSFTPGQFVMVRVGSGSSDPLLRRAFGVYKLIKGTKNKNGTYKADGFELVYKVVGKATNIMKLLGKGDSVDVIGPVGNSFPEVEDSGNIIMVAGGVGIAPFYMVAKENPKAKFLLGARNKTDSKLGDDFKALKKNKIIIATEDGSVGTKGFVTDALKKVITKDSVVLACGPTPMLKAVSLMVTKAGAKSFVSLEGAMACAMGVCLGCAVKTTDSEAYKMVCSDGPIFDGDLIDWQLI